MLTQTTDTLDADELFHLALKASEKGDHNEAIVMLKKSLVLKPDAKTQYILAAEHAEIGMYERAAEEMEKATELDNTLYTAYFQLGLLNLMMGKADQATSAWENLTSLDKDDPLQLFGSGMIELVNDNLEDATSLLEAGLKLNVTNPALNKDIQNVLKNIQTTIDLQNNSNSSKIKTKEDNKSDSDIKTKANPLFLASYDNKDEH